MSRTLSELVNGALHSAALAAGAKVASEAPAEEPSLDDELLAEALGEFPGEAAIEPEAAPAAPKTASSQDLMSSAVLARDFAASLKTAAAVVMKLAEGDPSPQVTETPFENTSTVSPKAPGSKHVMPAPGQGTAGQIPNNHGGNNKETSPNKVAADRAATERLLNAKIAQQTTLAALGQTALAAQTQTEINALQSKLAEGDPSPQVTESGEGSHVPDNAGMASLTKSQARDANTRQAGHYMSTQPSKDNAVPAHLTHTEGQKISKLTADGDVTNDSDAERVRSAVAKGQLKGTLGGAAMGAGAGYAAHRGAEALAKRLPGKAGKALSAATRHINRDMAVSAPMAAGGIAGALHGNNKAYKKVMGTIEKEASATMPYSRGAGAATHVPTGNTMRAVAEKGGRLRSLLNQAKDSVVKHPGGYASALGAAALSGGLLTAGKALAGRKKED